MNQKDRLIYLTNKFHSGKSSTDEEKELLKYIRYSKPRKKEFIIAGNKFSPSSELREDLDLIWDDFRLKYKVQTTHKLRKSVLSGLKYAAIFVLGFLAYLGYNKTTTAPSPAQDIMWYETYVPKGHRSQIFLPDGTKIWINSESKVRYSSEFNVNSRTVHLEGEAYFEVVKNADIPFVVSTNAYTNKALGTRFNVMAYENFGRTETSLIEGAVEISGQMQGETSEITVLKPGEKICYNHSSKHYAVTQTSVDKEISWKDNQFVFMDIPFLELIIRLERWYDVTIILDSEALTNIRYTGRFRNQETIWQVLDIIKLTTPIKYTMDERILTITES